MAEDFLELSVPREFPAIGLRHRVVHSRDLFIGERVVIMSLTCSIIMKSASATKSCVSSGKSRTCVIASSSIFVIRRSIPNCGQKTNLPRVSGARPKPYFSRLRGASHKANCTRQCAPRRMIVK